MIGMFFDAILACFHRGIVGENVLLVSFERGSARNSRHS